VEGILARQRLPDWNQLWDDFMQKEIWENYIAGGQCRGGDQVDLALVGQAQNGKGKAK